MTLRSEQVFITSTPTYYRRQVLDSRTDEWRDIAPEYTTEAEGVKATKDHAIATGDTVRLMRFWIQEIDEEVERLSTEAEDLPDQRVVPFPLGEWTKDRERREAEQKRRDSIQRDLELSQTEEEPES